jgi:hypothetical protein
MNFTSVAATNSFFHDDVLDSARLQPEEARPA